MRIWRYVLGIILAAATGAGEAGATKVPTDDNAFLERRVTVDGSTYRYRVFVPHGWSKTAAWLCSSVEGKFSV